VHDSNVGRLQEELATTGWTVFLLSSKIRDKGSFFNAIRDALPLDPPVSSDHWDALADSLWSGLDDLSCEKVAIIWPASMTLLAHAPDDFEIARSIFVDLAASLGDHEATVGSPTRLAVLLSQ
jgi:hypothetical protein